MEEQTIIENDCYIATHPILEDWNNPENDHWEDY